MIIGIDASRAFLEKRTGIEEYSFQVIKNLRDKLDGHRVVLYVRKGQDLRFKNLDLRIPENWKVKVIRWPRFWTQIGLSLEMLFHPIDVLFVPAHTVPLIHPKNTVVTIHGLEYEFFPKAYPFFDRLYMRFSIKNSCRWASKIISVSENTKRDLMKLYKVPEEKTEVVSEGYTKNLEFRILNLESISNDRKPNPYLLFIGRLEERKNVIRIIDAFEILKEKYKIPHQLVLAGKPGFGYEKIRFKILESRFKKNIKELGYISDEEKGWHLKNASVFLFPTLYEGFGLPILEAQSLGVPVVASNNSSIPEVVDVSLRKDTNQNLRKSDFLASAELVDPMKAEEIAEATWRIISDEKLRNDLIEKGLGNIKRFSWEKCATAIAEMIQIHE